VALALLFGVAGTIQYHAAQFFSAFDRFFGDRGDVRGQLYFCEHWYRALSGKASLLSPGIFSPTKGTLAYSDLLLGYGVPYSLFRALGFDMFSSFEILIILTAFLSYCAAFWLLYKTLAFRLAPSIVGAMFFAFSSPKFFQLIHVQLQFVVLLPVIFALLITFGKQAQTLDQKRAAILLSLAAVCFDLQIATGFYFAWFFVFWSTIFFMLALAFTRTRRFIVAVCRKFWRAISVAAAVLLLGFLPTFLVYLPQARAENFFRYEFLLQLIPHWRSLMWMGGGNYLWGWLTRALAPNPIPGAWGELQIGIGLVSSITWIALIIATIWLSRGGRDANTQVGKLFVALMILTCSLFYVIGFRYAGHSPWYIIYRFFPAAGALRGVSRYVIFLTLPMSIGFAYLLDRGLDFASRQETLIRKRAWTAAVLLLGGLIVFEQFGLPKLGGDGFSVRYERAYLAANAAKLPQGCEAFYIALGPVGKRSMPEYQYDAMMLSAITGVPTLNASSSLFPKDWDLYTVSLPDYETKVNNWIASQKIAGKVCRLETGPEIDAFDPTYPNPVNDPNFFVRQMVRDFTGEEPKKETIDPLLIKIAYCISNLDQRTCDQSQIALETFLSTGFHERGSFILRLYEAGLKRLPHFDEFTEAMTVYRDYLSKQPREQTNESMKSWLVLKHSQSGFLDVKALNEAFAGDEIMRRFSNRTFVALHYYGFLQREPDAAGLASWTEMLDRRGDPVLVTAGFISSAEYRNRLQLNSLRQVALNRGDQRLPDSVSLVAREHVVSAAPAHARARLFN
jgi:hypothetical protein